MNASPRKVVCKHWQIESNKLQGSPFHPDLSHSFFSSLTTKFPSPPHPTHDLKNDENQTIMYMQPSMDRNLLPDSMLAMFVISILMIAVQELTVDVLETMIVWIVVA